MSPSAPYSLTCSEARLAEGEELRRLAALDEMAMNEAMSCQLICSMIECKAPQILLNTTVAIRKAPQILLGRLFNTWYLLPTND